MGASLRIETAPVFLPLLAEQVNGQPVRYRGAWGGRGSAKSWFFADLLLERCMLHPGTRAVCVREIQRSLEQSVKRLLDDEIARLDLGGFFHSMDSKIETPGGGVIIFQGMQDHTADSIKSLEGFDVAWVEEAQAISNRSLTLLRPTIRKPGSEIWCSWNPKHATDPVDVLLRGKDVPPNAIVIKSSWQDNPWFPKELTTELKWDQARDPEKYAHVWLGEYESHSEARVFKNWRVEEFDTPTQAVFYFGADWGFAEDPTVLVRCWIEGRRLYVDREVYKVGCEIDHTPALFDSLEHGQARKWVITADSARPETISYMRRNGYPKIKQARKGPGSVEEGVAFLQSYDVIIHPRCQHAIDEFTLYHYKTDKMTDQVLPVLEDKENHVIDALRYAVEAARKGIVREVKLPVLERASDWSPPGYVEPHKGAAPELHIPVPERRRSEWSY